MKPLVSELESLNEMADRVYALREAEKIGDALRKQIKALYDMEQMSACMVSRITEQDKAVTEYCSGEDDSQPILEVPNKRRYNPEAFDKLMEYLGIDSKVIQEELVRPMWVNVQEKLRRDLAEGKHVPVKMDKGTEFRFKITKRKEIT